MTCKMKQGIDAIGQIPQPNPTTRQDRAFKELSIIGYQKRGTQEDRYSPRGALWPEDPCPSSDNNAPALFILLESVFPVNES